MNNMWVICGSTVGDLHPSHMMDFFRLIYPQCTLPAPYSNQNYKRLHKLAIANFQFHQKKFSLLARKKP